MSFIGFVLEGGGIDSDTSGLLLRGFVDFCVLYILSLVLFGQELGDRRSKGCLPVIDMTDCSHYVTQ